MADGKKLGEKVHRPVVIFGTGNGGMIVKWMLEDFGVSIKAFTDNIIKANGEPFRMACP